MELQLEGFGGECHKGTPKTENTPKYFAISFCVDYPDVALVFIQLCINMLSTTAQLELIKLPRKV